MIQDVTGRVTHRDLDIINKKANLVSSSLSLDSLGRKYFFSALWRNAVIWASPQCCGQNQMPAGPKPQFGIHFHTQTCGKLVAFVLRDEKSRKGAWLPDRRLDQSNNPQYIAFIYFPHSPYTLEEVRKFHVPQLGAKKATQWVCIFSFCRYNPN